MYTTEEFRTQVYSYYEENGIVVGDPNEGNWEQAHIVPRCVGGTETVLLLHGHHCYHDLIQSKEYNRMCFYTGTTHAWLYGEGFLCENWFELVELYEYYVSDSRGQGWVARKANATARGVPATTSRMTSAVAKKAWETKRAKGPDFGSEIAQKAWETKRRKAALQSLRDYAEGALWADGIL